MISVALVDRHSFTRGCVARLLKDFDDSIEVIPFESVEDFLASAGAAEVVLYHEHESDHNSNDRQLNRLRKLLEIGAVIILSAVDNPEAIADALAGGARGYIPTASTPAELMVEIIRLVRAGGTFVPPSSLQLPAIARKRRTPKPETNQPFTPRQMAVLDHLRQGKANKIIAYELAMSESTVKVHVRNIMKKMSASNRTEVAYRTQMFKDGLSAEVISNGD